MSPVDRSVFKRRKCFKDRTRRDPTVLFNDICPFMLNVFGSDTVGKDQAHLKRHAVLF